MKIVVHEHEGGGGYFAIAPNKGKPILVSLPFSKTTVLRRSAKRFQDGMFPPPEIVTKKFQDWKDAPAVIVT